MNASEDTPTTSSRLTRVEQAVQRIENQVSQLLRDFAEFKARVECMIEDHQSILYGAKDRTGLVHQSEHLEELERALKGYGREPGLIADIKNLLDKMNKYEDANKWLTRVILGAILAELAVHLLGLP